MIKFGWWFSLDIVVTDDEGEKVRFISFSLNRFLIYTISCSSEWDTT